MENNNKTDNECSEKKIKPMIETKSLLKEISLSKYKEHVDETKNGQSTNRHNNIY